jgi:molybdopterin converting factor small subunit
MSETVTVQLYGSLTQFTGGVAAVDVEASTIREVFAQLIAKHPALQAQIETNISVSIDGRIYTESLFETVSPANEIILLPRIAGG